MSAKEESSRTRLRRQGEKDIPKAIEQCGIGVRYLISGPSEMFDVADVLLDSEFVRQIRADERAKVLAELRFLAEGRRQYCHLRHEIEGATETEAVSSYHAAATPEQFVHNQHTVVAWAADVIEGKADTWGWLPSWLWDKYTETFGKPTFTKASLEEED